MLYGTLYELECKCLQDNENAFIETKSDYLSL